MHILVLGGNGFIGSHFVAKAAAAGHQISVLSRRPAPVWAHGQEFRLLSGGFETLAAHPEWLNGVDAVCHCAWSTVPKTAAADPQADVSTNVLGTLWLLDMIRAAPSVSRLLFLSSGGAVYGNVDQPEPIRESQALNPISAYGIGKLAAEKYCQLYSADSDLDVTIIRPSNPYGPGQSTVGVLGVVSTFLHHAINGTPATMFGDGSVVRDFLDVRDLADLMLIALQKSVPGIYNAGSGTGTSLADVARYVEKAAGKILLINQLPERAFDPKRIVLDISSAKRALGWSPDHRIETSLADLTAN